MALLSVFSSTSEFANSSFGMLLLKLAACLGVQWLGWAAACMLRTEKFYDLTGELLQNSFRCNSKL